MGELKINRELNIVLTIDTDSLGEIFVHSVPISRDLFQKYFRPISMAFADMFGKGLSVLAGPAVGYLTLRDVSLTLGVWEGSSGVENGLINEIVRLTNVIYTAKPGDAKGPVAMGTVKPGGWQQQPLQSAISRRLLTSEELDEIMGELVFFTCVSCVAKRGTAQGIMKNVNDLWQSRATALSVTDYLNSLPISIEGLPENTASDLEKAA